MKNPKSLEILEKRVDDIMMETIFENLELQDDERYYAAKKLVEFEFSSAIYQDSRIRQFETEYEDLEEEEKMDKESPKKK